MIEKYYEKQEQKAQEDPNLARLSEKVDNKKRSNNALMVAGQVTIVLLGIASGYLRYQMETFDVAHMTEARFERLLVAMIVAQSIIAAVGFYAIYLLFSAIIIMRAQAKKIGN